jgi:hypothetical protein
MYGQGNRVLIARLRTFTFELYGLRVKILYAV